MSSLDLYLAYFIYTIVLWLESDVKVEFGISLPWPDKISHPTTSPCMFKGSLLWCFGTFFSSL